MGVPRMAREEGAVMREEHVRERGVRSLEGRKQRAAILAQVRLESGRRHERLRMPAQWPDGSNGRWGSYRVTWWHDDAKPPPALSLSEARGALPGASIARLFFA
jgi:hypothetical protein